MTGRTVDRAKFKTPSRRNVAVTGPYMHDARFAPREELVACYSGAMERAAMLDANLAQHPIAGLLLTAEDQRGLGAFLRTLIDPAYQTPVPSSPVHLHFPRKPFSPS